MRKTSLSVLLLVVFGAALWCYQASEAEPSATPGSLKVGVVNVAEVLMQCQENLDKEKEGKERGQKITSELKNLEAEAKAIEQELRNALEPGSQEFMDRRKEWFNKQANLQALREYQKEALTIESQVWTETLYEKLLTEVARVARRKGIALVFNKDESSLKGRKLSDLYSIMLNRKILYNAPTLELTAEVLESMDLAYERLKAAK